MVSSSEGLVVYEKDGGVIRAGAQDCEKAGMALPATNVYANENRYFTDCVKQGVPADRIKPSELKTVLELLAAFWV